MSIRFHRLTKRILVIINIVVSFLFLLACLSSYLHPKNWWFISFLGLGFPFILALNIFFLFFWLMVNFRYAFISLIALLIGWKNISFLFALNIPKEFIYSKHEGAIRIVNWNVRRFIELKRNNNAGSQTRLKMMELLKQQNADILCLQEFFDSDNPLYYANLQYIINTLNYPYYYFSRDDDGYLHYYGSVIFSRYPIIDSGILRYPRPTLPDALIFADIKINNDTIRVYTTHLQSFQFIPSDYKKINQMKNADEHLVDNSRRIFSKLKRGIVQRSLQADIVKQITGDSPYPYLLCGDFNDVPNSYTYLTVRRGLKDAFLEKGFGIGRTFYALSPTLRIDYIFATDNFSVLQYKNIIKNYSDHYMLLSDLKLKR